MTLTVKCSFYFWPLWWLKNVNNSGFRFKKPSFLFSLSHDKFIALKPPNLGGFMQKVGNRFSWCRFWVRGAPQCGHALWPSLPPMQWLCLPRAGESCTPFPAFGPRGGKRELPGCRTLRRMRSSCMAIAQGQHTFSWKGPDSKYFSEPYSLCYNYSTLPL